MLEAFLGVFSLIPGSGVILSHGDQMTSLSRLNFYGISILFFTSILFNCVKEVEQHSLLERNGLRYEVNSDKPFSGKAVNGDSETTYKDGKKHGHDIWISDGIKRHDISYINGNLNGSKYEWYETGQKKTEAFYQGDMLLGKLTTWFENGQLELEENFKAGVKQGISKSWRENGYQEYEKNYVSGKLHGASKSWNTDGQLELEVGYKNGIPHGTLKTWHSNGQQKDEAILKNGKKNGLKRTWYEDGLLYLEETYVDNELDGLQKKWGKDGRLETQTYFENGKEVEVQEESLYDGNGVSCIWIFMENASRPFTGKAISNYSTYGYGRTVRNEQLKSEVLYIDGKKNGLKRTWFKDGQLQLEETYVDNELDGLKKEWYSNGQLHLEETYVDNELDGLQKKWYWNGQLKSEITFRDEKISGLPKGWFRDGKQKTDYNPSVDEADAFLSSIRTQLRVYYGENGEYPTVSPAGYVIGATWNDILMHGLTGIYFADSSFTYLSIDDSSYIITCAAGKVLKSDRTLDQAGALSGGY
jgi:uncharacterized protein